MRGPLGSNTSAMLDQIDQAIRSAATEFVSAVFADSWRGREREAISLFALGYLIRQCRQGTVLYSPTQITVEGAVPGVPHLNPKGRVNKDLVIWSKPAQTCWDEAWRVACDPLAVLEWKVFRPTTRPATFSKYDLNWLVQFSQRRPNFVGYAVMLDLAHRGSRFAAARVSEGSVDADWLRL